MNQYSIEFKATSFNYGIMEFSNINVREVLIEGKSKGEYHIQIKVDVNKNDAIYKIKNYFINDKVKIIDVDPDNILNLDYIIAIVVNKEDQLFITNVMTIFTGLNDTFQNTVTEA